MLRVDAAKVRYRYHDHFLRTDLHKSRPASGRVSGNSSAPQPPVQPCPPSEPRQHWKRAPPRRSRPSSACAGVRQLSARRSPGIPHHTTTAPSEGPPSPQATEASARGRHSSTRHRARSASPRRSLGGGSGGAIARGGGGGGGRRAASHGGLWSGENQTRSRPNSAPPCPTQQQVNNSDDARDDPEDESPRQQGSVGRRPSSGQTPRPAFGSIYYNLGDAWATPGPGYYCDANQTSELGSAADQSQPSAWGQFGTRAQERAPDTCGMYNTENIEVGPGKYEPRSTFTDAQSPRCRFASMTQSRMPGSGGESPKVRLPLHCHRDPRFAHHFLQGPAGEAGEDDRSMEQGLAFRCARPVVPNLNQRSQEPRLKYHGAAFRLGGYLVIPSGNEAGPSNVSAQAARWRQEGLQRSQARQGRRVKHRPASAYGRAFGFSRAQRF
mmetsp:Transcript_136792/g.354818  ORF Transcript_136792/g.354818 Transcript_136792/m.354818 type:complete len:439 (+) Transcript_136792:261-1577(+)